MHACPIGLLNVKFLFISKMKTVRCKNVDTILSDVRLCSEMLKCNLVNIMRVKLHWGMGEFWLFAVFEYAVISHLQGFCAVGRPVLVVCRWKCSFYTPPTTKLQEVPLNFGNTANGQRNNDCTLMPASLYANTIDVTSNVDVNCIRILTMRTASASIEMYPALAYARAALGVHLRFAKCLYTHTNGGI